MKQYFKIIVGYPALLLLDVGIYFTIGGNWKTIRRYSNNKLKQIWNRV
jgi:hypothetical protein